MIKSSTPLNNEVPTEEVPQIPSLTEQPCSDLVYKQAQENLLLLLEANKRSDPHNKQQQYVHLLEQ